MRISFICNPVYIGNGWSPWDTRVGGSEECIIEWARRLSANHEVQVFHNGQHGNFNGVKYRSHEEYEPGDITINVNYPYFEPQGKTIYFTSLNENPDVSKFDAVCVISQYAKENTGIKHKNVHIVPPGYNDWQIYPGDKIPKQCLYASSPDRGLEKLLDAWPYVYQNHPDATLVITYGGKADLPGVINLGEVDEMMMNELYRTSDIWCHPNTGIELYCMTGIKAQAAGCVPVVIPSMALAETVRHGYKLSGGDYGIMLSDALDEPEMREKIRHDLLKEKYPTWHDSVNMLEKVINSVVEKENKNERTATYRTARNKSTSNRT